MAEKQTAGLWPTWNKARMTAFIDHLSMSSNVAESERVAKMMPGSSYRQRRKDAEFDRAWRDALRDGYARLELAMLEGALATVTGEGDADKSEDQKGTKRAKAAVAIQKNTRVRVSERTAMALLTAHRAAAGAATVDRGEGARARLARKLADMNKRMGGEG